MRQRHWSLIWESYSLYSGLCLVLLCDVPSGTELAEGLNIWEPGQFGWVRKDGTPVPEPEPEPSIAAWAIGQAVVVGDLRSHNGKVWKAKVAHTTHAGWEPSAAAWAVWEEQA